MSEGHTVGVTVAIRWSTRPPSSSTYPFVRRLQLVLNLPDPLGRDRLSLARHPDQGKVVEPPGGHRAANACWGLKGDRTSIRLRLSKLR